MLLLYYLIQLCTCGAILPTSLPTGCRLVSVSLGDLLLYVIDCTDLSGKELHRQVVVDIVATSGSLCGVMVITLALNSTDVGSIFALGTIFPIFIIPATCIWVIL